PLPEGTEFELEMYDEDYHGRKNPAGSEEGEDYDDDITLDYFSAFEWEDIISMVCTTCEGSKFGFKVVDGITYLTIDNFYFGIEEGENADRLIATPDIPPKNRRIQIQYAEDGNIFLTGWDGNGIVD
ncbi:hypothetical protein FB639_006336, partial [Coemansia asiatica]